MDRARVGANSRRTSSFGRLDLIESDLALIESEAVSDLGGTEAAETPASLTSRPYELKVENSITNSHASGSLTELRPFVRAMA